MQLNSPCCCDGLWSLEAYVPPGQWWRRPACVYTHGNGLHVSPLHMYPCHLRSAWCHLANINHDISPSSSSHHVRHWEREDSLRVMTLAHLRAHKSHSCTCPESPGWWRRVLPLLSHPPTWWPAPSCSVPPEWRLEGPCAWKSRLLREGEGIN